MSASSAQFLPVAQDITTPCNHDCKRCRLLQAPFGHPVRSHAPAAVSFAHSLPARKAPHGHRCHPVRSSTRNEQAESSSFKAEGDPLLQKQIDDAADVVTGLMDEINERLFLPTAIADITGDSAETTEEQAIREAVERRIDSLDDSFIGAVRAFEVAARSQSLDDVADRLSRIEQEVMSQVASKLPAEMLLLDEVQQMPYSQGRVEHLKQAVMDGKDDGPRCNLTTLQSTANQVLDDMEDKEIVPNKQLLARLCLVREELAVVAEAIRDLHPGEARDYAEARAAYQKLVPLGTAAFLKELMPVTSPERRHVLLSGALEEGLSEEAGKSRQKKKRDHLRPGKLLTLMSGMQRELTAQGEDQHAQSLSQLEANRLKLLQLLEAIGYPS